MPTFTESVTSKPDRVDRENGLARGVKIVGLSSPRKNRQYTPEALKGAASLYEGAKVNLNHQPRNNNEPRRFEDRFGRLANVQYREGQGLYADLRFNPEHPAAASFAWWAVNDPNGVGMSHVAKGESRVTNGTEVVESIVEVVSVDLVADPATNAGLFESENGDATMNEWEKSNGPSWLMSGAELARYYGVDGRRNIGRFREDSADDRKDYGNAEGPLENATLAEMLAWEKRFGG